MGPPANRPPDAGVRLQVRANRIEAWAGQDAVGDARSLVVLSPNDAGG